MRPIVIEHTDGSRMSKVKKTIEIGAKAFGEGFLDQMADDKTVLASVGVGLFQGLKYTGSLKRGLIAGGITELVFCTANGLVRSARTLRDTVIDKE